MRARKWRRTGRKRGKLAFYPKLLLKIHLPICFLKKCRRLVLAEPGVLVTAATNDRGRDIVKIASYDLGFGVSDIMDNAVSFGNLYGTTLS